MAVEVIGEEDEGHGRGRVGPGLQNPEQDFDEGADAEEKGKSGDEEPDGVAVDVGQYTLRTTG
jgi:hypothetical protein